MDKKDIKSSSLAELKEEAVRLGEKAFRGGQLFHWLHQRQAGSFAEMDNLPKGFREKLEKEHQILWAKEVRSYRSKVDGTRKFVFELYDGSLIETVLMSYKHGNSVCISSQAGCRMGCRFCASTVGGLTRSLTASEMLSQIYEVTKLSGERVSHVVVMGSGEPLDNYQNLVRFIRLLSCPEGLCISQRNITVSTCGLVPGIRRLAEEKLQITLALSLHASTDEKRRLLMPVAESYSLAELMDACRYYYQETGRRLTFEYGLAAFVNDKEEDAKKLAGLLKGLNCHVNLIPINPVEESRFREPDKKVVIRFQNKLEKYSINVTIRREMGRDIKASCGQLRQGYDPETRALDNTAPGVSGCAKCLS